ncbi:MAG: M36 family metallopeptidase [Candidatus Wallbacteria bacterium]|nr:M36 family metallopeptidase [Candidatus Wallbacteria bacterium]
MRAGLALPLLLALLSSAAHSAFALQPTPASPSAHKPAAPSAGVSIRAESVSALEALRTESNEPFEVRWDAASGVPARIFGASTEPMGSTPEEAARNFLRKNARVFAMQSTTGDLKTMQVRESLAGQHVRMLQHVKGLPVIGAEVSVHMDKDLRVQTVNNAYVPGLANLDTASTVSREAAIEAARKAAGVTGELRAPATAEKAVFAKGGVAAVAWRTMVPSSKPLGDFEVVVNAKTGKVLSLQNLIKHADVKAKVFDPNPVVTLKNNTFRDNNDADNIPAEGYKEVTLLGLDGSGKLRGQFVDPTLGAKEDAQPTAGNFFFKRNQPGFEQAMVYYHIDRAQRYIQSIGFNNVNNRQQKASAHGTTDDNSWYSPATKELTFGDGGVDDAEDADVILHEYGHSIQDNQVPGFGGSGEAGAMGEGFGDYWGSSVRSDQGFQRDCVASWDGTAYSQDNPPCLRRVDGTKHYPEAIQGEVHADGEIWSACLWQVWNKVGKAVSDKIVLEAHFHLSPSASFADGANALVQADKNLFQGAHVKDIKQVFVTRGILKSSGRLRVSLKDAANGKPCAGRVSASGLQSSLQVGATGVLESDVVPGTYTLSVSSFGYLTQEGKTVTVEEDQTASIEFALAEAPRFAVTGSVKRADTGEAISARIYVADTPVDPVQTTGNAGTFSVQLPAGKYTFKAVAPGFRTGVQADVDVSAPKALEFKLTSLPPVLLVDDDDGAAYEKFFKDSLTGSQFDVWTVKSDGQLTAESLLAYPVVIWFTGADYRQTLTDADQALVKQYLQGGGRLFLTGAEIAYSLKDKPFLKEVLGAEFVADSASAKKVSGQGLSFAIEGGDGANNQQSPDVVKAAGQGVKEFFAYDGGQGSAALSIERDGAKTLYFSFGFEGIDTKATRDRVMKMALDYLKPSLAERVSRLARMDAMRQAAPAADQARWMNLEETYEKLMAGEVAGASAAERAGIRGLLNARGLESFRNLKAVLQAK